MTLAFRSYARDATQRMPTFQDFPPFLIGVFDSEYFRPRQTMDAQASPLDIHPIRDSYEKSYL